MKLANGSVETILNEKDFEDILDKYLGTEAVDYFQKKVEELESKVEDLEFDLDNQKDKYKELEEEYEEYRIENPRHRF
jgi:molecular chaperone GrpE (heat shock protein)